MYMCVPAEVEFGLQTQQCLVYCSHNYTMANLGSVDLALERFSSKLFTKPENVHLQDRRDGKSSV